jgi:dephospho-CoA kinase
METIFLTGFIGSGKSAVSALLRERGIPVYDSDARTKALYDESPVLVPALEETLGMPLRTTDGKLDRKALAAVIFNDDDARERVESLVYPAVLEDFLRWREAHADAPFVVLESAIILSKPIFNGLADRVVLVTAPQEVRLQRVMARDGLSEEEVIRRMDAQQLPLDGIDTVIQNDGTPEQLRRAVDAVFFPKK